MVYIDEWEEFSDRAAQLFMQSPEKTRYTFKYRHADSEVVLKVTDDRVCLKYRTDQASDMRLIENFNQLLCRLMGAGDVPAEVEVLRAEAEAREEEAKGKKGRRKD